MDWLARGEEKGCEVFSRGLGFGARLFSLKGIERFRSDSDMSSKWARSESSSSCGTPDECSEQDFVEDLELLSSGGETGAASTDISLSLEEVVETVNERVWEERAGGCWSSAREAAAVGRGEKRAGRERSFGESVKE